MKQLVAARIEKALAEVAHARAASPSATPVGTGDAPIRVQVERPKKPEHGDFATNVALSASKRLGVKPLELANALKDALGKDPMFARVDVAGPGFLNVKLAPAMFHAALREVIAAGPTWGRAPAATGERINLEFVSANPTGPLHMAHGRGAVTGDAIGRLLEAAGHRVIREYYVNDAGNQIKLLVDSVLARALGKDTPEGGYGGAYVTTLAEHARKSFPKLVEAQDVEAIAPRLVAAMLDGYPGEVGIRQTVRALGIDFDVWTSEGAMHRDGRVARAIDTLQADGWLKKDGDALAFETTRLGDDKDRVVYKSDGGHTYFASDIAYHKDKLDRGFDRLIDVWGADHHGYIPRVRAALRALGLPAEKFEIVLVQMVALLKDGQPYRMGKRLGNFITIDEVLEEIDAATGRAGAGRDALRYYFCARRWDAQLEIDVEIAKKQSLDNPVYYLQYGHARLCAILRKAAAECGIDPSTPVDDLAPLVHADELAIVAMLAELPALIAEAAAQRTPHAIVGCLTSLAQAFQSYYTRLKQENDTILPREAERADGSWKSRDGGAFAAKVRARVAWVRAIRDVYGAGLGLLGIGAPERLERPVAATPSDPTTSDPIDTADPE
ncbi:MAG: arginine--tRNA ligase [Polyangiales bacterium]